MPTLRIDVGGLGSADTALRRFARTVDDLRPFWRELGVHLADTAPESLAVTPTYRTAPKSLVWRGDTLGPRGIFESSPDRLQFGSAVFYGRFHQHGAKHTPRRPLIHIDEAQHSEQVDDLAPGPGGVGGLGGHMTPHEAAIKRYTDPGGTWPPKQRRVTRWPGTGRYARRRCTECGHESRPLTSTCALCGERLHEGN